MRTTKTVVDVIPKDLKPAGMSKNTLGHIIIHEKENKSKFQLPETVCYRSCITCGIEIYSKFLRVNTSSVLPNQRISYHRFTGTHEISYQYLSAESNI